MKETILIERTDEVSVITGRVSLQQCPSMKGWVLGILHEHGRQTLDEIGVLLPHANWAQLFLAIDKLNRDGAIGLRSIGHGEYLLNLRES
jgi:hypothetical protein